MYSKTCKDWLSLMLLKPDQSLEVARLLGFTTILIQWNGVCSVVIECDLSAEIVDVWGGGGIVNGGFMEHLLKYFSLPYKS